jgi:hypothetical protein
MTDNNSLASLGFVGEAHAKVHPQISRMTQMRKKKSAQSA